MIIDRERTLGCDAVRRLSGLREGRQHSGDDNPPATARRAVMCGVDAMRVMEGLDLCVWSSCRSDDMRVSGHC